MANLTPEQQTKMREAFQKALAGRNMQDLSQEERMALFAKVRAEAEKLGIRREAPKGDAAKGDAAKGDANKGGAQQAAGGPPSFGFGGPGGQRGGGQRGQGGGPAFTAPPIVYGGGAQFTKADFENAALPPPPEEKSELAVILRPGLLADVEIIVEKVPDAVYVPNQSVFEREGKTVVYVRNAKGGYDATPIQIAKKSETVTIVASGIAPGATIALSDPLAKPGDRKKGAEKKAEGGGAMGALPGKGGQQ
jgi:hypothetical protein